MLVLLLVARLYACTFVMLDPKEEKILGEGWNRMPKGCEDKFAWTKGVDDILKTKYHYGKSCCM